MMVVERVEKKESEMMEGEDELSQSAPHREAHAPKERESLEREGRGRWRERWMKGPVALKGSRRGLRLTRYPLDEIERIKTSFFSFADVFVSSSFCVSRGPGPLCQVLPRRAGHEEPSLAPHCCETH